MTSNVSDQPAHEDAYTVWKFPLAFEPVQVVPMPDGADILHVGIQHGVSGLVLWARCRPSAVLVDRRIVLVGTGHQTPPPSKAVYIGTVMESVFVWHLFDGGPAETEQP